MLDVGHNGGPPIWEDDDGDPRKLRWAKINVVEFLEGMAELTWEQRGFYTFMIFKMYARMDGLPYDERAGAIMLGCDIRFYRRLRDELIAAGKLYIDNGNLHNKRVVDEITAYCKLVQRRRDAANIRWQKSRVVDEMRETSPGLLPQVPDKSGRSPGEVSEKSDEKAREINVSAMQVHQNCINFAYENQNQNHKDKSKPTEVIPEQYTLSEIGISDDAHASKPKRKRASLCKVEYPKDFEAFWNVYPDTRNNSKAAALAEWTRLSQGDKRDASASLAAFTTFCQSEPTYRVLHAERYLKYRRFEGYVGCDAKMVGPNGKQWGWWVPLRDKLARLNQNYWREAVAKEKPNGTWPWWLFGPAPGHPESLFPTDLAKELGLWGKYGENQRELAT